MRQRTIQQYKSMKKDVFQSLFELDLKWSIINLSGCFPSRRSCR